MAPRQYEIGRSAHDGSETLTPLERLYERRQKRDFVTKAKTPKSEPRRVNERVAFRLSETQTTTWTIAAVRTEGKIVGDSFQTYQLRMSDGQLYKDGEWVAQNRLLDA